MAHVTTMKVSTETRDRLRALADDGDSLEDVVVAALDRYEHIRFWDEVEAAAVAESAAQRAKRTNDEAHVDGWVDRLR